MKRPRTCHAVHIVENTAFCLVFILADDNAERDVRRASIAYDPLYSIFQERLDQFRRGESAELFQRGAEQVVHNFDLYDTRRSSEDRSGDFTAPNPEDPATPSPPEAVVDEEERSEAFSSLFPKSTADW